MLLSLAFARSCTGARMCIFAVYGTLLGFVGLCGCKILVLCWQLLGLAGILFEHGQLKMDT